MSTKARTWLVEICAFLLILLFVYTSVSKWLSFKTFYGQINNQPFDNKYTSLLVYGIPAVELLMAGLLMFQKTRLWGFYGSTILMALFTGYVGLVLTNYYGWVPCSCGGAIEKLSWPQHLVFNIFFTLVGLLGIILLKKRHQGSPPREYLQSQALEGV